MILSDLYVVEGRSHPELNPKRDIISELAPYQYDPNAYITFVSDAGITSHVARGPVAGPIVGRGSASLREAPSFRVGRCHGNGRAV